MKTISSNKYEAAINKQWIISATNQLRLRVGMLNGTDIQLGGSQQNESNSEMIEQK